MLTVMAAINHLKGKTGTTVDLLNALTDEQLQDQIDFLRERREQERISGDANSVWRYGRAIASACKIQNRRH